nr:hypothetical protein [Tanacetum cinerariifolium]
MILENVNNNVGELVAGSESRPPMLNKENYVPWSSRLLRRRRPSCSTNGKCLLPMKGNRLSLTIITKDLHTADYTQLYDFLKYNQKEVDELKAERLAKIQDPLALMENSNNPYVSPAPHQDVSPFNQNYLQQPMTNPEDIINPTTAMNMALSLMAKAFKLNYSTPTNNNQRISLNPRNRQIAQPGMNMGQDRQMQMVAQNPRVQNVGNQNGLIGVQGNRNQNPIGNGNLVAVHAEGNVAGHNGNQIRGLGHFARDYTVRQRRMDASYLQTQLLIAQKEEAGIQLQAKEYDLMAAAADLDEIEKVNTNCILMANLQQASSSGTQTDSTPVYDSDGSAEKEEAGIQLQAEEYDLMAAAADLDEIEEVNANFILMANMQQASTSEEQYTELLEPIPESYQVPQNDNDVISEDTSVEQGGETVEQHPANVEETRALYDSLYQNLAIEVEKVNSVNRKLKETNADLTTELNQKAKVSVKEIQKKYQPKALKRKNVGTRESLATPKPRKPRFLLRWSPTRRLFDHDGKLVASSKSESHVDCSNGDNACTSNEIEPKIRWFPNSTSLLGRLSRFVMVRRL